ncbi:hypothetical protein [Arthrobacter pityocampae]|uniref:hypothetical protein n=1 Tax=Arthrobacter pityocampae TaxID=547334 RepID=UPI003735F0A0
MTMGTNGQKQSRSRTRSTKRDVLIYGFGGMVFAFCFVMALPTANTWYLILGSCLLAVMAVVYVAKAILALRQDNDVLVE